MLKERETHAAGELGRNLRREILRAEREPVTEHAEKNHQQHHTDQKRLIRLSDSAVDDGFYN